MSTTNGWTDIVIGRTSGGVYEKYRNAMVVIIPPDKKRANIFIPRELWVKMGQPPFVKLSSRASNVGIFPVMNILPGSRRVLGTGNKYDDGRWKPVVRFVCKAFLEKWGLKIGVYDAHMEAGGVLVFDTAQTPAQF